MDQLVHVILTVNTVHTAQQRALDSGQGLQPSHSLCLEYMWQYISTSLPDIQLGFSLISY